MTREGAEAIVAGLSDQELLFLDAFLAERESTILAERKEVQSHA